MPDSLNIESGSSGKDGLIFLYLTSSDSIDKLNIMKAYKSLNAFNREIYKDPSFVDIELNLSKYRKDIKMLKSAQLGKKYLDNYIKYGYCNWYDWTIANWGTKWNVNYDCQVEYSKSKEEYSIVFDTAWCCPKGILEKYGEMCNDGELNWMYYDEEYNGHIYFTKEKGKINRTEYFDINHNTNIKI